MVTYQDTLERTDADPLADEQLNDVRVAWVIAYRRSHPEADRWAEGVSRIKHGVETQERVFRMVEQLAARGIDRVVVFAALHRADALVDAAGRGLAQVDVQAQHLYVQGRAVRPEDITSGSWGTSVAAAAAGCAAIDRLMPGHGTVVSLLCPEALEDHLGRGGRPWLPLAHAGRAMIVIDEVPPLDHLRASGFDPIMFDGADPAAFAWAILELSNRVQAAVAQRRCECHLSFVPIPLGVAVNRRSDSWVLPRLPRIERPS